MALLRAARVTGVIGRARHERLGAGGDGALRKGQGLARRVELVEALQRIDRTQRQAVAGGRVGDLLRGRAVGQLDALQVVADLDRADAETLAHGGVFCMGHVRRADAVDGEAIGMVTVVSPWGLMGLANGRHAGRVAPQLG